MAILFARYRVLHDLLLVDRNMKENTEVGTYCFLKSRIDPISHAVTCITRAVERGMNHSSEDSPILFVHVPIRNIAQERTWIEKQL